MDTWILVSTISLSYLLGAISFPRLAVRLFAPEGKKELKNIELDVPGSEAKMVVTSMGASTASEILGSKAGCAVGFLDMAKVFAPTLALRLYFPDQVYFLMAAVSGVIGHCWPVYYKFKGGRGFSSIYGGLLAIDWLGALVCSISGWVLGLAVFRNFLLVYLSGLWLIVPWMWLRHHDLAYVGYALVVNILFILAMIPDLRQYAGFMSSVKNITLRDMMMSNSMGRMMLKMEDRLRAMFKQKV